MSVMIPWAALGPGSLHVSLQTGGAGQGGGMLVLEWGFGPFCSIEAGDSELS